MLSSRARHLARCLFCALALLVAASVAPGPVAQAGNFPDVSLIEQKLERGVSTKADVRKLLGTPDGFGTAVWPPDHRLFRVWYYEDMEVLDMRSGAGGVQEVSLRQQLLAIFFDGDKFDGFSWTSNVIPGDVRY